MANSHSSPLPDDARLVAWVRQAAPYIHAFRGKTFVIAFGGEALLEASATALIHDIALLDSMGIRLVLVHGARPQIDAEMRGRGLTPRFHNGLRVTDAVALECVKRAIGVTRIEIEALLSQGLPNTPLAGGFLRVTGGNFISAKPVGVVDGVDFQSTGSVRNVIFDEINADLAQENVVLISPIAASPSGEIFNLAWEEVAQAVAIAVQAEKLIFLGESAGIVGKKGQRIDDLTADAAEALLKQKQAQPADIQRVLPGAIAAVRQGVKRAHFLSRHHDGAMLLEFFTRDGVGTILANTARATVRVAAGADVGSILALIAPLEADGTLVKRDRARIEMEIAHFSVLQQDNTIVGCAALYPYGEPTHGAAGELACLAVMPDCRELGYGDQLRAHIEARAKKARIKRLFVLTTRTAHWFIERGYAETDVTALPKGRQAIYNLQRRSKVFVKELGKA